MDVIFHPDALEELREALQFYRDKDINLGNRFLSEVQQSVNRISIFPEAYPAVIGHGIRQCRVTRFPYAIVYRLQVNYVQIIAIAHAHRKPGYWKKRS